MQATMARSVTLTIVLLFILTLSHKADGQTQRFDQEPHNASVVVGSTAILSCQVASRVGQVQWTKGGFGLGKKRNLPSYPRYSMIGNDEIGSFHLVIQTAQLSDDDFYQCQVSPTATSPGIVSRRVKLNILIPPDQPIIINQPTIAVRLNQSVNITCQANGGKPGAEITWYKNHVLLTTPVFYEARKRNNSKLVDAVSYVTIRPSKRDSGRKIECRAMNAALGEPLRATAILDVQYAPEIVMSSNLTQLREYQSVLFVCEVMARPFEISWKWYRDNNVIEGQTGHRYVMSQLSRDDNGVTIACEATNTVGSVRVKKTLNVEYGPKFIGEARHVAVDEGSEAILRCEADGNPKAGIHWTSRGSNNIIHNLPELVIRHVHKRQFGVYVCTAIVLGFHKVSRDIYLLENSAPKIMRKPKQFAQKGDTVQLVCTTMSVPHPTVMQWMRDGQALTIQKTSKYTETVTTMPYGRTSVLTISNLDDDDFGVYNCSVINSYGKDMISIVLTEKEVFPLAYIVGGAVGGVAVIFILVIGCVLYHKHKGSELESSTDSESSLERKQKDATAADLSNDYMYPDTLNGQFRQRTKEYEFVKDFSGDYRHMDELNDIQANNNGYLHGDHVPMYAQHPDILPSHQHHTYPGTTTPNPLEFIVPPHYRDTGTMPHSTFRQTPVSTHSSSDTYSRLPAADPATAQYGTNV